METTGLVMHALDPPSAMFLKIDEVAGVLRTSPKAIYTMVERGQLPGVCRLGRRVLIRRAALLDFLDHNSTPSSQERRR